MLLARELRDLFDARTCDGDIASASVVVVCLWRLTVHLAADTCWVYSFFELFACYLPRRLTLFLRLLLVVSVLIERLGPNYLSQIYVQL